MIKRQVLYSAKKQREYTDYHAYRSKLVQDVIDNSKNGLKPHNKRVLSAYSLKSSRPSTSNTKLSSRKQSI